MFARKYHVERSTVSVQLQDNQEVDLTATAQDAAGNAVANPGTLTWSVDDSTVLTVTVSEADQAVVTVSTTGKLGVATVTVNDDLDGDPTTAEAVGSLSFEVVTGPVTQITVGVGAVRERGV
jgi:hypothetical protein